jgi:ABC-type sugar transport system permease subunit
MDLKKTFSHRGHYGSSIGIFLFLLPGLFAYTLLMLYPTIQSFVYSMINWKGVLPTWQFVGFKYYIQMVQDPVFVTAIINNLRAWALNALFMLPLAMTLAYMLHRFVRWISIFRTLYYIPAITSAVMLAFLWRFIIIKAIPPLLALFHLPNIPFLFGDGIVQWTVNFPAAWADVGFWMIIFMAGMASVSQELIEAAQLDGAGEPQLLRHIILPGIWGLFLTANVAIVASSLGAFIYQQLMPSPPGGPNSLTHTLISYTLQLLWGNYNSQLQFWGKGSSFAVFQFTLSAVITFVMLRFGRRAQPETRG